MCCLGPQHYTWLEKCLAEHQRLPEGDFPARRTGAAADEAPADGSEAAAADGTEPPATAAAAGAEAGPSAGAAQAQLREGPAALHVNSGRLSMSDLQRLVMHLVGGQQPRPHWLVKQVGQAGASGLQAQARGSGGTLCLPQAVRSAPPGLPVAVLKIRHAQLSSPAARPPSPRLQGRPSPLVLVHVPGLNMDLLRGEKRPLLKHLASGRLGQTLLLEVGGWAAGRLGG